MKFLYIYICMCVMVLGLVSFFLIPFRVWSGEMERVMKEVKRRYSSFLGDFEKEYIFPLDCKGSAGWTQYLRRKKG